MTDRVRFPTEDLSSRLLLNGGEMPGDRGLFPENLRRAPRSKRKWTEFLGKVRVLMSALRDLTNINVRQPSHIAPPFRAEQWAFHALGNVSSGSPLRSTVLLNGNAVVPNGMNGTVQYVDVSFLPVVWAAAGGGSLYYYDVYDAVGGYANPMQFTLLKNDIPLPGWLKRLPRAGQGGTYNIAGAVAGGPFFSTWMQNADPEGWMAPIVLRPGDTLQVESRTDGASAGFSTAVVTVLGYLYPQEGTADGVRGTLADRGWGELDKPYGVQ